MKAETLHSCALYEVKGFFRAARLIDDQRGFHFADISVAKANIRRLAKISVETEIFEYSTQLGIQFGSVKTNPATST
jgi:hypothetical protein